MPTTIKAALKKWEEATGRKAAESKEIKLIGVYPPIEKMDGPLHLLMCCEKFSLSTNLISNINNLQSFKNLKVLSLGRNLIKSLQGIEGSCETLEQLWISYNQIDRMKPIRSLSRLKVLYMAHNFVRDWREFEHLMELPCLEDLVFVGNPIEEDAASQTKYTEEVTRRLLYLKKLDGYPVIRDLVKDAAEDDNLDALDMNELDQLAGNIRDEEGDEENDDEHIETEMGQNESFVQEEQEQNVQDDEELDSQASGSVNGDQDDDEE